MTGSHRRQTQPQRDCAAFSFAAVFLAAAASVASSQPAVSQQTDDCAPRAARSKGHHLWGLAKTLLQAGRCTDALPDLDHRHVCNRSNGGPSRYHRAGGRRQCTAAGILPRRHVPTEAGHAYGRPRASPIPCLIPGVSPTPVSRATVADPKMIQEMGSGQTLRLEFVDSNLLALTTSLPLAQFASVNKGAPAQTFEQDIDE